MLYWVWNDKKQIEIKRVSRVLSTVYGDGADELEKKIKILQVRLGSEGSIQAVQKLLARYVPAHELNSRGLG